MRKTIRIETDSYNDRRLGKPWIAKVNFAENKKGEYLWGNWIGTAGGKGTLEIDTAPGDIIAQGQKDHRKPRNSAPDFHVVTPTGTLEKIGDKGEAYKYWVANKETTPDIETLKKEKEALLARIVEIDSIINK